MNNNIFYRLNKTTIKKIDLLQSNYLKINLGLEIKAEPGNFFLVSRPGFQETVASILFTADGSSFVFRPTIEFRKNLLDFDHQEILFRGPYGKHWLKNNIERKIIIADSLGILPIIPLVGGEKCSLIYAGESPNSLLFRELFQNWKKTLKSFQIIVKNAPSNYKGRIGGLADILKSFPEKPGRGIVLISLYSGEYKEIIDILRKKGISDRQIFINYFFKIKNHLNGNLIDVFDNINPSFEGPIVNLYDLKE